MANTTCSISPTLSVRLVPPVRPAFDELVVLYVAARHEVKNEIALAAAIQPALVRRTAFAVRLLRLAAEKTRAAIWLAVPDVDHAAIVELRLVGAIHFGDVVMPVATDQPEVVAGVEPAAVMLGEPLADIARLHDIALVPELVEPGGTLTGSRERVEHLQRRGFGDPGEIGPVETERGRRRGDANAVEVGRPTLGGPAPKARVCRDLELALRRV